MSIGLNHNTMTKRYLLIAGVVMCATLHSCQKINDETKQTVTDSIDQPADDGFVVTENPWPDTATGGTFDLDTSTITIGDTTTSTGDGDLEG